MAWSDKGIEFPNTTKENPYKNGNNRKIFVDLDGVTANFAKKRDELGLTSHDFKLLPGSYRSLEPYPEAIVGINALIDRGFDVWIATKIPTKAPWAATEKLLWVNEHLPRLEKSVIITPNKGTLGSMKDFLIDDRPHKAHCEEFKGTFLRYGHENEFQSWEQIMKFFDKRLPDSDIVFDIPFGDLAIPVREDLSACDTLYILDKDVPKDIMQHCPTDFVGTNGMIAQNENTLIKIGLFYYMYSTYIASFEHMSDTNRLNHFNTLTKEDN